MDLNSSNVIVTGLISACTAMLVTLLDDFTLKPFLENRVHTIKRKANEWNEAIVAISNIRSYTKILHNQENENLKSNYTLKLFQKLIVEIDLLTFDLKKISIWHKTDLIDELLIVLSRMNSCLIELKIDCKNDGKIKDGPGGKRNPYNGRFDNQSSILRNLNNYYIDEENLFESSKYFRLSKMNRVF